MATRSTCALNDVVTYLIFLASQKYVGDNSEREGITNLKLQKILYFAQAYYLAKVKKPLFSEDIEAWEYGPVVPKIYRRYKKHGSNPLIAEKDTSALSFADRERIGVVWDMFGKYSAGRLVAITHANEPWKEAYQSKSKVITKKSLQAYYASLLNG